MPEIVWKASGHLDRFIDPITRCKNCGAIYRPDKLLKSIDRSLLVEEMSFEELSRCIKERGIKCPSCGGELSEVTPYNLMIKTTIGVDTVAYLRPETATTTYLLFNRLLVYYRNKLPIKVFQYGKAYRNEISPRRGVIRLREFEQLEAQIFILREQEYDTDLFENILNEELNLLPWDFQKAGRSSVVVKIKDALDQKFIKKPAFAYTFYVATKALRRLGFSLDNMRFRQHSPIEKAHYADDAWDLEVNTKQYGWLEVCGVHDRTNYDLRRHSQYSGEELTFQKSKSEKEIPQVLEIAFGVERLTYVVLEKFFEIENGKRNVLRLPPFLAPFHVAVFPLIEKNEHQRLVAREVFNKLVSEGFRVAYDASGNIGRRYRRHDEIGTPFCITIDYQTLDDRTVTIRDRDTMKQIRCPIDDLPETLRKLIKGEKKIK